MSHTKTGLFGLALACLAFLLWQVVKQANPTRAEKQITFTQFLFDLDAGRIRKVTIYAGGVALEVMYSDETTDFRVLAPANYPGLYNRLEAKHVEIEIKERSNGGWISIVINASPFLLLLGFWLVVMRQMQKKGNKS